MRHGLCRLYFSSKNLDAFSFQCSLHSYDDSLSVSLSSGFLQQGSVRIAY